MSESQNTRNSQNNSEKMAGMEKKNVLLSVLGGIVVLLGAWLGIDLPAGNEASAPAPSSAERSTSAPSDQTSEGTCPRATLPTEAQQMIDTIHEGGPYKYPNDGTRFGNYENRLPSQSRNYYREYTVDTPGLRHRGERRIVTGGTDPDTWYYTDDHYESFCEIPDA